MYITTSKDYDYTVQNGKKSQLFVFVHYDASWIIRYDALDHSIQCVNQSIIYNLFPLPQCYFDLQLSGFQTMIEC
jgi:hypothetical protein